MSPDFRARIVTTRDVGLTAQDGPAPAPKKFRWRLFRLLERLACLGGRRGERRGLVVIRMDGIGDMVLFRRSLDHYAEIFGVAPTDISVLGCHAWADLADDLFAGYRVQTIHEHRFHKKPLYRFRVARWLYRQNFRVAVLDSFFRKPLMDDSLMLATGAEEMVTCVPYLSPKTRAQFAYSLSRATKLVDTGGYPLHEAVRHFLFLSAIAGRDLAPEPVRLAWRDRPPALAGDGAPYVVLNFGSNEYGRRWPLEKYLECARWLLDSGYRVVFCGARNDLVHAPEIRDALADDRVVDVIGKTTLPELMDILKHAAAVLTNDTGPAHLSIALGTPTLVLVGGGHFGSFVPYAEAVCPPTARFLNVDMDCYHCFWGCPYRENDGLSYPCVAAIEQDDVRRVLGELLEAPR